MLLLLMMRGNSAPNVLTRGYLPPPQSPPLPPMCETVTIEVDEEIEMEECKNVDEQKCTMGMYLFHLFHIIVNISQFLFSFYIISIYFS